MVKEEDVKMLIEMGFPEGRARKALVITKSNLQTAMDWLLQHANDADIDEPLNVAEEQNTTDAVAKSFKCEECGKFLRDAAAVELHAHRTGHENFAESTEEIKPLTEEEKKEQLAKLKAILQQKRQAREMIEKEEDVVRERERRKSGKEGREAQAKYQETQHLKELERQRKEKEEERKHREKVRAQIEQDKAEKKARAEAEANAKAASQAAVPKEEVKKDYTECRIQIRLPNNSTLTQTFGADDTLQKVVDFVKQAISVDFELMSTFPRKVYTKQEFPKTLKELNLVPSCALICKIL